MTTLSPDAFAGQGVIVTGAAQGIGRAAARGLAELGADVMVVDLLESVEEVGAELAGLGTQSFGARVDVTDEAAVEAMAQLCLERLGRIDVLITAAGGFTQRRPLVETSLEEWERVLRLNLTAVFLCCRAVLPAMLERGQGRIVNVASEAGRTVQHLTAPHYSSAKGGVISFTRHLAREVAAQGITVNAVAPGVTLSPRIRELYSPEVLVQMAAGVPMGRVAEPADQADPIIFLASDQARYMTGVTLDVSGGRVMM
ncbi:MAG TPA: SDR family NAD(P)-dependent oxidoreductase [Candidatus Nitrosotalea sp.]|nr:SDR family NAD(P)-dependent oxidoreductase [Candidatus Nitrosotalea sp.]